MKIKQTKYEKETGTQYYSIDRISNWELERLYLLLEAEEQRSKIVHGFNRGSVELKRRIKEVLEYHNGKKD